jgi:predicted DNA-binding protein
MPTNQNEPEESASDAPLRTLYVACTDDRTPAKIGFTSDLSARLPRLRRHLGVDIDYVWTAPHPAAPEIEARVKATLSPISLGDELFDTDADVLIAVAETEIDRFDAELEGQEKDLISFRLGADAADHLDEQAEAEGRSVSAFLRSRVRAYLNGDMRVEKPTKSVKVSRSFRLSYRQAQALRVRAGRQGRTCSELIRRLILDGNPLSAGGSPGVDSSSSCDSSGNGSSGRSHPGDGRSGDSRSGALA